MKSYYKNEDRRNGDMPTYCFDLGVTQDKVIISAELEAEICSKFSCWNDFNCDGPKDSFLALIGKNCPCWWDTREEELKEISKEYPSLLFALIVEDVDSTDRCCEYYKNGKLEIVDEVRYFPDCSLE